MFKLFFLVTLCSAIFLWYCHEYHTDKFLQFMHKIPYSAVIFSHINEYMSADPSVKLFTPEELKEYTGVNANKGIYLAILGEVYDVGKGRRHYEPGAPYHGFAGRDASRSFVTNEFHDENSLDHVMDLSLNELLGLREWSKFYKREYEHKGRLVGRYYDKNGRRTKYGEELQKKFNTAEKNKVAAKEEEQLFPPCNVEWHAQTGTKVWCSKESGGIKRNWIGVPRKLYSVGSESYRCACINIDEIEKTESPQHARRGLLQQYDNCDPYYHACTIKE